MSKIILGRVFNMVDRRLQDAERVWNDFRSQIHNGNSNHMIYIQGMVFAALDQEQIEYILVNYL
jgi:hypothetical protein